MRQPPHFVEDGAKNVNPDFRNMEDIKPENRNEFFRKRSLMHFGSFNVAKGILVLFSLKQYLTTQLSDIFVSFLYIILEFIFFYFIPHLS